MNTDKFTQDEWTVAYNGNVVFVVVKGTESDNTPDVICSTGLNSQEHRSNAQLIAAAPEMYRILEEVKYRLCCLGEFEDAKEIVKVLKKARGEE